MTDEPPAFSCRNNDGDWLWDLENAKTAATSCRSQSSMRAAAHSLQDRVYIGRNWQTKKRDVTDKFKAAFDLERVQRGWLRFPKGAAPDVTLVPAGEDPARRRPRTTGKDSESSS